MLTVAPTTRIRIARSPLVAVALAALAASGCAARAPRPAADRPPVALRARPTAVVGLEYYLVNLTDDVQTVRYERIAQSAALPQVASYTTIDPGGQASAGQVVSYTQRIAPRGEVLLGSSCSYDDRFFPAQCGTPISYRIAPF